MKRELVEVKLVSSMPVFEYDTKTKNRRGESRRVPVQPGAAATVWAVIHPAVRKPFRRRADAVAAARRAGLRIA